MHFHLFHVIAVNKVSSSHFALSLPCVYSFFHLPTFNSIFPSVWLKPFWNNTCVLMAPRLLGSSCETVDRISQRLCFYGWMKTYFTEAKRASSSQSIFCEGFDRPELLCLFQRHLVVCLTCVWAKVLRPPGDGRGGVVGGESGGCHTWQRCLLLKDAEDGALRGHCCDPSK